MAKGKYGVLARLVWDGGVDVLIPGEMGTPRQDQMKGGPAERLTEMAGRVCYDSLGKGRSSGDYHRHIQEVGHFSVCEHFNMTVEIRLPIAAEALFNRPGLWIERKGDDLWRITFNPRCILDWNAWSKSMRVEDQIGTKGIGDILSFHAERAMPMVLPARPRIGDMVNFYEAASREVQPESDEEKWVSLFVAGSRGFSHELVRHGDRTAISQRSTRYVDEDGSPWVDHPLVQEFLGSNEPLPEDPDDLVRGALKTMIEDTKNAARTTYARAAEWLQKWLISRGVDKFTARKQARGAARGYLGNALYTEIVFSASVAQWRRMLRMRCCDPADAEIRAVFAEALEELKRSRYGLYFDGLELVPACDRIGYVASERKAKCLPDPAHKETQTLECICAEYNGKGRSTCGGICPVHPPSESRMC